MSNINFAKCINKETGQLDLLSCGITDEDVPAICRFVNANTAVRSLNLSADDGENSNKITTIGCKHLAAGLSNNRALVALHLNGNSIGNEGLAYLTGKLKHLTLLALNNTGIDDRGMMYLKHLRKLVSLDVGSNALGELGIYAIAEELPQLKILLAQNIGLRDNQLDAISAMPSLIVLNISHNQLTDVGAAQIAKMQTLCFLDAGNNLFTDHGRKTLANMRFSHVESRLSREFNQQGSIEALAFHAIWQNPQMKKTAIMQSEKISEREFSKK